MIIWSKPIGRSFSMKKVINCTKWTNTLEKLNLIYIWINLDLIFVRSSFGFKVSFQRVEEKKTSTNLLWNSTSLLFFVYYRIQPSFFFQANQIFSCSIILSLILCKLYSNMPKTHFRNTFLLNFLIELRSCAFFDWYTINVIEMLIVSNGSDRIRHIWI